MRSTGSRILRRYALYFLVWTAVGVFFFSQDLSRKLYFQDPTPWWQFLGPWLIGTWLIALFMPGLLWLGDRFPVERRNWPSRIALHLVFSIVFSVSDLVVVSTVLPRLGFLATLKVGGFRETLAVMAVLSFHGNVVTYWAIWGIQQAFRYYRRYQEREREALRLQLHASELESQLVRAQLGALKMQLHPHFLFNTLNAIMVLVRQQRADQAEETLARLSDLLRCVLDDVEAQEVPLRRELEYLELYLGIEQLRFQDRMRVEIAADPAVLDAAVPHMGLQPLVENAIRHGIGRSAAAGLIRIGARRVGETLEITVIDDGPGLPMSSGSAGHGIGLANTRARLGQLYGDAARLTVENGTPSGVVATLVVPYREAAPVATGEVLELHAARRAHR